MQEPNYNLTDGNGNVIAQLGTNSTGDFVVEHSSGDQAVFNDDGLQVPAIDTGDIAINNLPTGQTESLVSFSIEGSSYDKEAQFTSDVSTSAKTIYEIDDRSAEVTVFGKVTGDGGSNFIDKIFFIFAGGASVLHRKGRYSAATRTYSEGAFGELQLEMGSGTYQILAIGESVAPT